MDPEVVVVGGGPAGLAAGLWLARYRKSVTVLDTGEYRNRWVEESHGYLGRDHGNPLELLDQARRELLSYPTARLEHWRALTAQPDGDGFRVVTDEGSLSARRLVVATGVVDVFPDIAGFMEHYGASAFHCPTCDGYETKGCRVVAYGWSEALAGFALKLLGWARSVTIVTDGRRFEGEQRHREALAENGVAVVEDVAIQLEGKRGDLRAVRLRSGDRLPCERFFFSVEHRPGSDLPDQLGCARTEEDCLVVDKDTLTTVPGVYAAGDVTPGFQLVPVAVAKGVTAGVACAESLVAVPDLD